MSKTEEKVFIVLMAVLAIGCLCLGHWIGKFHGQMDLEKKAIEAKVAERFVVWDKTNQPYLEFRWITNK